MIYLDTGCLVKLYYPEPDSPLIAARVAGQVICYCPLHELEFTNALHQKAFHGSATSSQIQAAKALVTTDLAAGVLKQVTIDWEVVYRDAVALAARHTAAVGCRSLDILHCAVARALDAADFVSTDGRQTCLAQAIGLPFTPI